MADLDLTEAVDRAWWAAYSASIRGRETSGPTTEAEATKARRAGTEAAIAQVRAQIAADIESRHDLCREKQAEHDGDDLAFRYALHGDAYAVAARIARGES